MNVLVVDDHATNRKLLRAQLEAEGHAILEAGDGVEALAVLERDEVEAIISDILMPNLDGFGLCLAVRKHERLSGLPFVFYTSTYTSAADMEFARTIGANRYLIKPAPMPALIAALRDASFQAFLPVPPDEAVILKQYNIALKKKLEDKEISLQETVQKLERAQERIAEPHRILERKVDERTAELSRVKVELRTALTLVTQLSCLLPICRCCKKISESNNCWQSVEHYVARHANASHGFCPECEVKHTVGLDKFIAANSPVSP